MWDVRGDLEIYRYNTLEQRIERRKFKSYAHRYFQVLATGPSHVRPCPSNDLERSIVTYNLEGGVELEWSRGSQHFRSHSPRHCQSALLANSAHVNPGWLKPGDLDGLFGGAQRPM